MKKVKLFILVTALMFSVSSLAFAQAEMKMGYVDLSKLFDEYHKTKEYDKVLEEKFNKFNDEMKTKVEKIKEQEGKLSLLGADKKKDAEAELEQAKEEAMAYEKDQKANLTKERNEKIRDILLEIEKVVKDYAEKENFNIILNDRVLIYGKDNLNVTDSILETLNANATAPGK